MTENVKRIILWVALALCVALTAGMFCGFGVYHARNVRGKTYEVKAALGEGSTIYRPGNTWGYRYGPTMMYNDKGTLEAWFSSPPANSQHTGWDLLMYRQTSDYGKNWTDEYVSIAPKAGTEEAYSVCDPAVIFMDGYYYLFYTSTIEGAGRYNNVYSARATAPDAEWQRWNGNGWGGDVVKPIIVYGSNAEHYGIGEPSVVVVDGKLYIYYTYKGPLGNGRVVNQTRLTIGDANENFPLTLSEYGVVVGDKPSDEDSLDVKYSPRYDVFVGVTTANRMSYRAHVKMYYSYDGKNFRETEVSGKAQPYLHNIGITGDGQGHIDFDKPQFVSYAYSEDGFEWGKWATEFQQISFTAEAIFDRDKANNRRLTTDPDFENGEVPPAWAMSEASEYRTALEAVDGDRGTFWSSVAHNVTGVNEWHSGKWYRESLAVPAPKGSAKALIVAPRLSNGGTVYGFPRAFLIQYSDDAVIWQTALTYSDYTPSSDDPITFSFGKKIKAKYFRICATELGADEFGSFIMQISEIAVG